MKQAFRRTESVERLIKSGNVKLIEERHRSDKPSYDYIKTRFLGKGGFAKCYEFIRRDNGEVFAAKVIPKASLKKRRAK